VLEQHPLYEKSGYTRQVVWYDKEQYRRQRIDFYDRKGALMKTLKFSDYRLYEDKFWRAHKMVMENHQTGKSTQLLFDSYAFRTGLTDGDFSRSRLGRMR
jgi:outer membrane lipoprotein-sorting protein